MLSWGLIFWFRNRLVELLKVYIHPFVDGNGRTARLLMNLILMQNGFPPVIIPVEERSEYYRTLTVANSGNLRPFIRFITRQTDNTLQVQLCIFFFTC